MAYDETLATRVRTALKTTPGAVEKKMFGGLCFLISGNMCCGVVGDELMVRVGSDNYEDALAHAHVREMDFTGRPLKGMVYVGTVGLKSDASLARWVEKGVAFASSLPPK